MGKSESRMMSQTAIATSGIPPCRIHPTFLLAYFENLPFQERSQFRDKSFGEGQNLTLSDGFRPQEK
jgi:hypothetical protein